MTYLSVQNFWKYQDRNAWKKAKTHPPWFKHYVHRDLELDRLPLEARLLFYELLAAATRYANVLEADLNWLWAETRIEPEVIAEMLPLLLKGRWLSETKSKRRGTGSGAGNSPDSDVQDVDVKDLEVQDLEVQDLEPRAVAFDLDAQPSNESQNDHPHPTPAGTTHEEARKAIAARFGTKANT